MIANILDDKCESKKTLTDQNKRPNLIVCNVIVTNVKFYSWVKKINFTSSKWAMLDEKILTYCEKDLVEERTGRFSG